QPLLATVAARPGALPKIATGLDAWAKAWGGAVGPGPWLNFTIELPVPDPYSFLAAAEGGPTGPSFAKGAFKDYLNPLPYSAADCPRSPGLDGPNCPSSSAHAQPSKSSGATSGAQLDAISTILSALGVRATPQTAAIGQLLLGPLFASSGGSR